MEDPRIKWGLMAGLGAMIVSLVFYLIDVNLFFNAANLVCWVIFIIALVKTVQEVRKNIGGFISFKEAFSASFTSYVIASLLFYLFYFVMFNFVDPGLADIQKGIATEAMEQLGGLLGEEQLELAMEKLEEQDFGMAIPTLIKTYLINLIFPGALIALIVGAVMKRKRPDETIV